jgi:rod shape determining protein RodA
MLDNNYYNSSFRSRNFLSPWGQIDWFLLFLVIALTAFGSLVIYSIEFYESQASWEQHWILGIVGIILVFMIARIRYEIWIQWHWLLYVISNIGLLAVKFFGVEINGSQSWLRIFGISLQPSEFAKVAFVLTLAALIHERQTTNFSSILRVLIAAAIPCFFVMLQPDLGTTLVFIAITLTMLYWGNTNLGWIILMLSPLFSGILFNVSIPIWIGWTVFMGIIAWFTLPWRNICAFSAVLLNVVSGKLGDIIWDLLQPYQKARITLFLNPEQDPLGGAFQLIQSQIAIGSGQVWGKGLLQGTQTQLNFIPEQHTDFIFSAIGEEFGFVGCAIILFAFWLVCWRLVVIAKSARDNFGSLLAIGFLGMIIFQTIINISMTIGLAPITGIPLPWLSYGGSSLLTSFVAIGLVESVHNYRQPKRF